jgi:hypothetical protein
MTLFVIQAFCRFLSVLKSLLFSRNILWSISWASCAQDEIEKVVILWLDVILYFLKFDIRCVFHRSCKLLLDALCITNLSAPFGKTKFLHFIAVLDPNPHGSAMILVDWIRIQVRKNDSQKKRKKVKKCIVLILSAGCSFLRARGFSCSLDVLRGGLLINIM